MNKTCEVCGLEYEARNNYDKVCSECRIEQYKAVKLKNHKPVKTANQDIIDAVREATKFGLSYGQYKGRGQYEGKKLQTEPKKNS